MAEFSGSPAGEGRRVVIAASRFNDAVTQKLVDGALDALTRHGVPLAEIDVVWVPGAWELPVAIRHLLAQDRYDAAVALGAVVRGDTPHFDYVAAGAATGLQQAAAEFDTPVAFGVLTCDSMEQALARAGGAHGNKGWDAALAALEMIDLFDRLDAADEA